MSLWEFSCLIIWSCFYVPRCTHHPTTFRCVGPNVASSHFISLQVTTIFSTLERVAALDPKHSDVVLLENHAAFQNR